VRGSYREVTGVRGVGFPQKVEIGSPVVGKTSKSMVTHIIAVKRRELKWKAFLLGNAVTQGGAV